jgi:hypothetical protein
MGLELAGIMLGLSNLLCPLWRIVSCRGLSLATNKIRCNDTRGCDAEWI